MNRILRKEQSIACPIETVFSFFSDASNLDRITPPWLHFRMRTPIPVEIKKGTILEYALRLRGIPFGWVTEITEWDPPHRFVDEQRKGPYRAWIHEHAFVPESFGREPSHTLMKDTVHYSIPGGILEPLVQRFLVGPDLEKIFEYRRIRIRELVG